MSPPRVVSLIASATEIVCALGCEDWLVGRSHECDFPPSVQQLLVCTEPKFRTDGTSYEIDQRVKAVLQEGLSVYRVHADTLKQLQPDVIVTQAHCEVCAVSLHDVEQAVADWIGKAPQIISLEPNALADLWAGIQQVADALGVSARGTELIQRLQRKMADLASRTQALPDRPTIACIEWIEPLMACGNWMPELVDLAGGRNLFGVAGEHSLKLTWEELREKDPDVILVVPCGFDIERTRRDMHFLSSKPGWTELRASRERQVYLADGNQFFNRPGPRLVESLEILCEIQRPAAFPSRHEGAGWRRF